jgi:glyoxylase-like metal-dependent hydrolase (beta-lactamase superfamily II)
MTAHNDKYPVSFVPNDGWDDRILVFQCGTLVMNFVVICERYVVIIDTLINPQTAAIMLESVGSYISDGRQLLVVNTHADWDHCWGNQLFVGAEAMYAAPILATRRCYERFQGPEKFTLIPEMQAKEPDVFSDLVLTPPTVLFDENLVIDGGDLSLRLFATPGHQPDHISILIPEISTLLAGDAAELPFPFASSPATLPQLRASLAHMAALNPAIVLYCHAPVTAGADLLRFNIEYFDRLEQKCREAREDGVPAKPAEADNGQELVNFPVTEALPLAPDHEPSPEHYSKYHDAQIRMMLEYLDSLQTSPITP